MSEQLEFNAEVRKPGKHWSRTLRKDFRIPAVIYGPTMKNQTISVLEGEVIKYSRSKYENSIFVLKSNDSSINDIKVLKKEVVVHPVSRRPVHVDFYALDLTRAVRVQVEVRFEGKAIGLKEGGLLNIVRRHVEVECLPTAIPQFLSVDTTNLGVGDSIHASELAIPEGVKLITLPSETLCTIVVVEEEKATPTEAAAAPAEGAAAAPAEDAAAPAAEKKD